MSGRASRDKGNCSDIAALESRLWEKVQKAYAASRSYRAGDNPAFAKALAEFERVANPQPETNVIPFRAPGGRT
jgi:hypothetical protein